eukprot:scaffold197883_cov39-Tisochrysis_lutea.AAC.3
MAAFGSEMKSTSRIRMDQSSYRTRSGLSGGSPAEKMKGMLGPMKSLTITGMHPAATESESRRELAADPNEWPALPGETRSATSVGVGLVAHKEPHVEAVPCERVRAVRAAHELDEGRAHTVGGVGYATTDSDSAIEGHVDPALVPRHVVRRAATPVYQRRMWRIGHHNGAVQAQGTRR